MAPEPSPEEIARQKAQALRLEMAELELGGFRDDAPFAHRLTKTAPGELSKEQLQERVAEIRRAMESEPVIERERGLEREM